MTAQPESTNGRRIVTADETIVADVPCINCGYNLRGLNAEGRCPECGRSIPEMAKLARKELAIDRFKSGIPFLIWALAGLVPFVLAVVAAFSGSVPVTPCVMAFVLGTVNQLVVFVVTFGILRIPPRRHRWAVGSALAISGLSFALQLVLLILLLAAIARTA